MIKKICLALALIMVLTVGCSCGNDSVKNDNDDATTAAPSEAPTEEGIYMDPSTADYSEKTIDAQTLYDASKVQGRTIIASYRNASKEKVDGIALDHTAAAIEFNACCEGRVVLNMYASPNSLSAASKGQLFINIYVDGELQGTRAERSLTSGLTEVVLAENIEKGNHTFLIERQNEAECGYLFAESLTLNGELDVKPADSDLYIEVIGDSITAGYGNLYPNNTDGAVDATNNPRSSVYEDGTQAYAYLALKELGADYSIICQQGIGCSVGWQPHVMLDTYVKTCQPLGRPQEWGFERKADMVIINLGTNDLSRQDLSTPANIQKGFEDFLKLVREKNPDAKILWAYGAMDVAGIPLIKAAVENVGGESEGFYAYTEFVQNYEGGVGHPVVSAHQQNATKLVAAVREILGE